MRPLEILLIMFCTFAGVLLPIRTCRPSGGGPLATAVLARKSAKKARAKSRRFRSAMMVKPVSLSAFLYRSGSATALSSAVCCPWDWIGKIARPGFHHVVNPERAARPQDARDLGGQFF